MTNYSKQAEYQYFLIKLVIKILCLINWSTSLVTTIKIKVTLSSLEVDSLRLVGLLSSMKSSRYSGSFQVVVLSPPLMLFSSSVFMRPLYAIHVAVWKEMSIDLPLRMGHGSSITLLISHCKFVTTA